MKNGNHMFKKVLVMTTIWIIKVGSV